MSVCLRKISNKLIPFNTIITTRQPTSKLEKKIPSRLQFLEDLLNARHISNGHATCALVSLASRNDDRRCVETHITFDNWRDVLQKRCQSDPQRVPSGTHRHHPVLEDDENFLPGYGRNQSGDAVDNYVKEKNAVAWNKYRGDHNFWLRDNFYSQRYERAEPKISNSSDHSATFTSTSDRSRILGSSNGGGGDYVYFSSTSESPNDEDTHQRTPERMEYIYKVLQDNIPQIFVKIMDYKIYDPQLKFTNNLRGGVTTVGLYHYVKQVALLRTLGHLRFAHVKMNILGMTMKKRDSVIVVRWQVTGISGLRVMLMFWKYKLWKVNRSMTEAEVWYDGVSTFHVGTNGLIQHHIVDRIMPQDSAEPILHRTPPMVAKLFILMGWHPKLIPGQCSPLMEAILGVKQKFPFIDNVEMPLGRVKT